MNVQSTCTLAPAYIIRLLIQFKHVTILYLHSWYSSGLHINHNYNLYTKRKPGVYGILINTIIILPMNREM